MNLRQPSAPPILYGAYALAGLSLIWSGYAITDLINSGWFGLSVALAGDIGWITVMWAEHRGLGGRYATIAGWAIALMVGALLVLHGALAHDLGQAIAGPFVVLVGKTVAQFALLAMRDPAALTAEQEAEINDVIREGERQSRLNGAQRDLVQQEANAVIERIRQEARITAARDRADFEITLDRLEMRAEIGRRTPIAIAPITPEQTPIAGASKLGSLFTSIPADPPATSTNTDREQKSIADLAREQVAIHPDNRDATRAILAILPSAEKESVAAAVRKARRLTGGYN
jgi:hypothetical protein